MKKYPMLNIILFLTLLLTALSSAAHLDQRMLIEYREEKKTPRLRTNVGKTLIEQLLVANGKQKSTTSCRLENKRVVSDRTLAMAIHHLRENSDITLENRETKNLAALDKAGTITFYGTALKFEEAGHLPKTSIKMRIRMYILNRDGEVIRSDGFEKSSFLEIKIKNPYPQFPLSVHKYRLVLPDEDILLLIRSDPTRQVKFFQVIEELKFRAHIRDRQRKESNLINTIFEQIALLAVAEPSFIKPTIGITYYRHAKQYEDIYKEKIYKERKFWSKKPSEEIKTRYFEITIDEGVRAFRPDFSTDDNLIDINKYFIDDEKNGHLITTYPPEARVVEFKQPDAIGYDGPGVIRKPHRMDMAQKKLWLAFVGSLDKNILDGMKKDKGKFSHIKSILKKSKNDDDDSVRQTANYQ